MNFQNVRYTLTIQLKLSYILETDTENPMEEADPHVNQNLNAREDNHFRSRQQAVWFIKTLVRVHCMNKYKHFLTFTLPVIV